MAPLLARRPSADRSLEHLYRQHGPDVYRYAYAVLRNPADAEDVTQTTFMNAYRALERGEVPESPQNWLIAIAHNVCRQRFRQAMRRVQEVGLDVDVADTLVDAGDDDGPSPEDIRRALRYLAFNQRSALVMRELEGRSYAEIADLLELSVSAVETLIFRARRALREQLEGSVTCSEVEHLLSKQLDGELKRADRSQLRAHLRECADCRTLARRQRAQRSALRALGAVPLPSSLASLFGGGGAVVASKVAAVVLVSSIAGGLSYQALQPAAPARAPQGHAAKRLLPVRPIAALAFGIHRQPVRVTHAVARPPVVARSAPPTPTTTARPDEQLPPTSTGGRPVPADHTPPPTPAAAPEASPPTAAPAASATVTTTTTTTTAGDPVLPALPVPAVPDLPPLPAPPVEPPPLPGLGH